MELPEKLKEIRDEASISFPVNISKIDSKNFTLSDIFKKGFNKCYEVMAEEFEQTVKPFALGGDYNKIPILQQQLAEKDALLGECREAFNKCDIHLKSLGYPDGVASTMLEKLNQGEGV